MKMDGSVLDKKSSLKMLGLTFSSRFDWGSYIISIAKIATKKIGASIHSIKFLSPEFVLYLYKSTSPCIKYCCHVLLEPLAATLNFIAPFYGRGSTASRLQPLRRGSLLFTIQFPEIPGTHFINLGRMKG